MTLIDALIGYAVRAVIAGLVTVAVFRVLKKKETLCDSCKNLIRKEVDGKCFRCYCGKVSPYSSCITQRVEYCKDYEPRQ